MKKLLALLVLSSSASLAQAASPRFALVTGETVAQSADMISGQFGWPGIEFGYRHGLNEKTDVGFVFGFLYSFESTSDTNFGILMGVPLRSTILRRDKLSIQVGITPGFTLYTRGAAAFAFNFPINGTLGVQVAPDLRIAAGADLVLKVRSTQGAAFYFEPIFGPAIEYYVDRQLSLSLDTRFGPVVTSENGADTRFGFRVQIGLAYRL